MRIGRGLIGWGVLALTGCFRPTQAVMEDVDLYGWRDSVVLEIANGDTATLRDLSFVVRSNRMFRDDSLHVEFCILTPDSCHFTERVSFPMQHRRTPAALRLTDEMPYRRRVVLNRLGNYRLVVRPTREVEGLEAVGINIVKSEEE